MSKLNITQAAKQADVSRQAIYDAVQAGKLEAHGEPRHRYLLENDVLEWALTVQRNTPGVEGYTNLHLPLNPDSDEIKRIRTGIKSQDRAPILLAARDVLKAGVSASDLCAILKGIADSGDVLR